jgi:CO/xanthine dehydrogenase FAD-binding subunit
MPTNVLAGDATVNSPASMALSVAAEDFFRGMDETGVGEGKLLASVEVPTGDGNEASTYVKRPGPASGYAMVGSGQRS